MILNKIMIQNKYFKDSNRILFICFPVLITNILLLIFNMKIGLFVTVGILLFIIVLIKPIFIYLFLISLFSIEGFAALQDVSYVKLVAVLLTIGLALRLAITKESIPKDNLYKYIFLFLVGSLVSFAFAKNLSVSVQIYITYISLFFLYIFTRYFLRNINDINKALKYLFFSTILIFAFVQIMGLSVRHSVSPRILGISSGIGDPNAFASYILVLLPLVFYRVINSHRISRFLYLGCLISFISLLVFTGSRGGILGFLGAAGVLIYHYSFGRMRQIFFFILIVASILYFYAPEEFWIRASTITASEGEDSSIDLRLNHYRVALKMFLDYPLAGVGLRNFQFNNMDYHDIKEQVVHNSYLEILTGGGLLSFIPFFLILINCWGKLKIKKFHDKHIRDLLICLKASFVSILITCSFISGDHKKILWFLLALISSSFYIAINNHRTMKIVNSR